MRIFVLTANYELRVSRKSHLREQPNSKPLKKCKLTLTQISVTKHKGQRYLLFPQ
jgi:hypothetical protein